MSASERKIKLKLHWWARGRSDGLIAIAAHLGWTDEATDAIGEVIGCDTQDRFFARRRAAECTEDQA